MVAACKKKTYHFDPQRAAPGVSNHPGLNFVARNDGKKTHRDADSTTVAVSAIAGSPLLNRPVEASGAVRRGKGGLVKANRALKPGGGYAQRKTWGYLEAGGGDLRAIVSVCGDERVLAVVRLPRSGWRQAIRTLRSMKIDRSACTYPIPITPRPGFPRTAYPLLSTP